MNTVTLLCMRTSVAGSMQRAMDKTEQHREVQQAYNTERNITPTTIKKDVKDLIELTKLDDDGRI